MNKVWLFIIFISIVFGLINNKTDEMIINLFDVPKITITNLFKIGSMLIIYNGMYQIALKSNCIDKLGNLFIKPVNKLFKNLDEETKKLISSSIICNLLGLGPLNMTLAIKIIKNIKENNNDMKDISLYLLINISSLCLLPLNLIALRGSFSSNINISFIFIIFISSFITTLIAIIISKVFIK